MKEVQALDPVRSALMSRVRQHATTPEESVATILRSLGHAYRRNVRSLPGSPDFANKRKRWAIFVNGCFWHHHTGCTKAGLPKHNETFWRDKFIRNRERDAKAIRSLRRAGFRVFVVWECDIASAPALTTRFQRSLNRVA